MIWVKHYVIQKYGSRKKKELAIIPILGSKNTTVLMRNVD
jgi:hypothetical protein